MSDEDKKKLNTGNRPASASANPGKSAADDVYLFDFINKITPEEDEDGEAGGSAGGQTGKIEFRYQDAISAPKRDDLLPPSEIRRLLIVHKDVHKERVNKQKATREERAARKEGKYIVPTVAQQLGRGGGGGSSPYKKHPISNSAQFSGIDLEVTSLPSENKADTNPELKDKLENKLKLGNKLQARPQFNPRPRPPGG